jgi:hypothetical protein
MFRLSLEIETQYSPLLVKHGRAGAVELHGETQRE